MDKYALRATWWTAVELQCKPVSDPKHNNSGPGPLDQDHKFNSNLPYTLHTVWNLSAVYQL